MRQVNPICSVVSTSSKLREQNSATLERICTTRAPRPGLGSAGRSGRCCAAGDAAASAASGGWPRAAASISPKPSAPTAAAGESLASLVLAHGATAGRERPPFSWGFAAAAAPCGRSSEFALAAAPAGVPSAASRWAARRLARSDRRAEAPWSFTAAAVMPRTPISKPCTKASQVEPAPVVASTPSAESSSESAPGREARQTKLATTWACLRTLQFRTSAITGRLYGLWTASLRTKCAAGRWIGCAEICSPCKPAVERLLTWDVGPRE
mmetsp:Transcript_118043/g.320363  ORF Transcript_118043/g.320363 Transcript_118043/m.320363 type:complete len:268 (+) Transcript_118043:1265-2068(+)